MSAMSVLLAECERSSLQPGYARVPNSRQDTEGNVWNCMSRDEKRDPETGEVVQKAGIYLTQEVAHSRVAMAKAELRRVTLRLAEVVQSRRHMESIDANGLQQFIRDNPMDPEQRAQLEADGEDIPVYRPRHKKEIAELAELEESLRGDESRLMGEAAGETVTYWFPADLRGVEFLVRVG